MTLIISIHKTDITSFVICPNCNEMIENIIEVQPEISLVKKGIQVENYNHMCFCCAHCEHVFAIEIGMRMLIESKETLASEHASNTASCSSNAEISRNGRYYLRRYSMNYNRYLKQRYILLNKATYTYAYPLLTIQNVMQVSKPTRKIGKTLLSYKDIPTGAFSISVEHGEFECTVKGVKNL